MSKLAYILTVHFFLAIFTDWQVKGQAPCTDDYFAQDFLTPTVKHNYASTSTSSNRLLLAGYVLTGNTLFRSGWIAQLSAQGSILWNRQYNFSFYNALEFCAVTDVGNNNFMAGGFAADRDTVFDLAKFRVPFLMKLDQYGSPLWGKYFEKNGLRDLEVTTISRLADGHFIIVMATANVNVVMKTDADCNINWSRGFYTSVKQNLPGYNPRLYRYFDISMPTAVTQLRDGNIAMARAVSYPNATTGVLQRGIDVFVLNQANGDTLWRKTWCYKDSLQNNRRPYADVKSLTELPSGELSCITSSGDSVYPSAPFSNQALNFVMRQDDGALIKVLSYKSTLPSLYCTAAQADAASGRQVLLLDNASTPVLLALDADGAVNWSKAYPALPGTGTSTLVSNSNGHYFFSSLQNGANKRLSLVKTDGQGNMECLASPLAFNTEDQTAMFTRVGVPVIIDTVKGIFWACPGGTVTAKPYNTGIYPICRKTCCTDTTGPAKEVDLCRGGSYTLPDNYVATENGDFPIVFKTAKGCDSIIHYRVQFSDYPEADIGEDQCFEGRDTIILRAAPGYLRYNWMGTVSDQNFYTVRQPGTYWVRISNACGSRTDSVSIFRQCEFDTYMPNAFTPNNDFLNDRWGISSFNKNRLIRLTVYNRWGQKIFQTTDPRQQWDGSYKGLPQEAGSYLYYLEMETLNRKLRVQKGVVLLIR